MSTLELFQQQISQLIQTTVLVPLSNWLAKEKGLEITPAELIKALIDPSLVAPVPVPVPAPAPVPVPVPVPVVGSSTVPTVPPSPSVPRPVPLVSSAQRTLPSLMSSGLNSSVVPASTPAVGAKSKPKSKPLIPENYSGPTCKYVFKRGEQKGNTCGKPVVNGGDYCDQCNAKKTTTKTTAEPKAPPKPAEAKPAVGFTTSIAKRAEKPKIELREMVGQPNTFVDTQTNIVVKRVSENEKTIYVAVGIILEDDAFRPLNEEEKKDALARNFSLLNENGKEVSVETKTTANKITESKITEIKPQEEPTAPKPVVKSPAKAVPAVTAKLPITPIPDIDD